MKHFRLPVLGFMVLAMLGAEASGQVYDPVTYWCAANFTGPQLGDCLGLAAQGVGPYFDCGPGGTNVGLCGGACCRADQVCAGTTCAAPTPTARATRKTTARTPTTAAD